MAEYGLAVYRVHRIFPEQYVLYVCLLYTSINKFQLLLPYPAYTAINYIFGDQNHASYNSMVVKLQKRFGYGLTILSTLTWSKNMDESSGGVGSSLNSGAQNAPQNPYNTAAEYSYSNVDAPVRLATAISYNLPFGKGQKYLGSSSRLLDTVIGGWAVNGVSVYQTGFPLQIYQNDTNSLYGYGAQRPNETSVSPSTSGSVEHRLYDYINPAAFTAAPQGLSLIHILTPFTAQPPMTVSSTRLELPRYFWPLPKGKL